MSKTLEFLDSINITYIPAKGSSDEVIIVPCPLCGADTEKFYVNTKKGLFNCKKCQQSGNLFQLKKAYGVVEGVQHIREKEGKNYKKMEEAIADEQHLALKEHPEALAYLYGRGFNDETITHFNLGYKEDGEGHWITIPHYENFELWNIKSRRFIGEKTFRRVNGQPTVLFGADDIDFSKKSICVVESETDLMAARQMGVKNSVGLTAGADTFKPEWLQIFNQFEIVYVLLNSDEAGQKGARKIAEKIGLVKCKNMILPTNDVNDYLMDPNRTPDQFRMEFSKAERFDVKDISQVSDALDSLEHWYKGEDGLMKGIPTGFDSLDSFIHGFQKEDLIIFTGDSGVGKTTFVNNMVMSNITRDVPVLGFYLEGQFNYYLSRMISAQEETLFSEIINDTPRWEALKEKLYDMPLYMYSGAQSDLTIEKMTEVIKACVQLYDVRVIMIDNLQRFVRGENNYTRVVSDTVSKLKDLAADLDITVLLIAHVNKGDATRKVLTKRDLKDSSTIYQDADKVLILQKIREELYLTIEKNRMGEDDINIAFQFDADIGKFREKNNPTTKASKASEVPRVQRQS